MWRNKGSFFMLLVWGSFFTSQSGSITIRNASTKAFFTAIYYVNNTIDRATDSVLINPGYEVTIARPPRKWWYDRDLVLASAEHDLKQRLDRLDFYLLNRGNVGEKWGNTFYIIDTDAGVVLRSKLTHAIVKLFDPTRESLNNYLSDIKLFLSGLYKKYLPIITDNPHKNTVAQVRLGDALCREEKQYLQARDRHVRHAWEGVFGQEIQRPLRIALVCGGGGYRAMLATVGFLRGLDKIGLLDLTTYISSLSGSTWAVASWLLGQRSFDQYTEHLLSRIHSHIVALSPQEALRIAPALLAKAGYNQPTSLIDIYGGMLAERLLYGLVRRHQWPLLSQQSSIVLDTFNGVTYAPYPLPIYTAIHPETIKSYECFEFTPFEMGSSWIPAYIPSWSLGRKFVDGLSVDDAPEVSFGYLMGVYGSAFSASLADLIRLKKFSFDQINPPFRYFIQHALNVSQNSRIALGVIPNFMYGMFGALQQCQLLTLVDAGIDCNLPYAPVSGQRIERDVDLIIFMDASANLVSGAWELPLCRAFAQKHGLSFARLSADSESEEEYLKRIAHASLTVLNTQDTDAPVMLYMPLCQDSQMQPAKLDLEGMQEYKKALQGFNLAECITNDFCKTFNFIYQPHQAEALIKQMEFNVVSNKERLLSIIEQFAY